MNREQSIYLKYILELRNIKISTLAEGLKISEQTLRRKINGQTSFSLKETKTIRDFLNLSDQEYCKIFLA